MINEALQFLKARLEVFVSEGRANAEPLIVLANPWSSNDSNKNSSFLNAISLINIEEEKIFKSQLPIVVKREDGVFYKKEPDLKLNLYILISAYNKNYEDGLRFISKVVSFFQFNSVFQEKKIGERKIPSGLPSNIEKLIIELHTCSFEQQNQIWASLSTGYLPSVIYKVKMLIVESEPLLIEPIVLTKHIEIKLSTDLTTNPDYRKKKEKMKAKAARIDTSTNSS